MSIYYQQQTLLEVIKVNKFSTAQMGDETSPQITIMQDDIKSANKDIQIWNWVIPSVCRMEQGKEGGEQWLGKVAILYLSWAWRIDDFSM